MLPTPPPDPDATLPPATPDADATIGPTPTQEIRPNFTAPPGYEIERELGRGGMGVVYLARQMQLNRLVALKMVLAGGHAAPQETVRFLAEAESIAALGHPNIVHIFETGTHEGRPFFTLEYCAGGSLDKRLAGTPQSPEEAAHLLETLARAVYAAHQQGIVHRDLKPANVLLSNESRVTSHEQSQNRGSSFASVATGDARHATPKITDFGLAKRAGSSNDLTATGAILGTPSYMAPEQAAGKGKEIGPPADIYSLGAILYECLTGRPPFRAATPLDTVLQVINTEPVPPTALAPKTPRDLETIVLKCLAKEPIKRYTTAEALADDLRRYLDGEPILARPVGWMERSVKWVRRNQVVTTAAAIVALALLTGLAASLWQARRANEQAAIAGVHQQSAQEQTQIAEAQKTKAEAAAAHLAEEKREALDILYATRINLARREWLHGLSYSARDFLAKAPQERRGWEYDFLRGLFNPERRVLRLSTAPQYVSTSADGTLIASSSLHENDVRLWDNVTGLELGTVPETGKAHQLRFAPRSRRLACAARPSVRLIDADQRRQLWASPSFDSPIVGLNWSADERSLHVVTADGKYRRLDATTGRPDTPATYTLKIDPLSVTLIAQGFTPIISPDGRYFAASYDADNSVKVWDLADGKLMFSVKDHAKFIGQLAFSPDSRLLASPGGEGTIVLREVPSGQLIHRLRGHSAWVWSAAFSSDGRYLATGSKDTTVRRWDVATGQTVQVYRGHLSEVFGVAFGTSDLLSFGPEQMIRIWPDSEPVLYADHVRDHLQKEKLPLLGHSDDADSLALFQHVGIPAAMAFSPDSRYIATAAKGDAKSPHQVIIRDLATRRESCRIAAPPADDRELAFSVDGKLLFLLQRVVAANKESPTELRAYHVATGQLAWQTAGPEAKGTGLMVRHPTGEIEARYLVGPAKTTIVRYDPATGKPIRTLELNQPIFDLMYTESGRCYGARVPPTPVESEQLAEFDPQTGRVLQSWTTGYSVTSAAANNGHVLATAHANNGPAPILLWNADTGRRLRQLDGSVGLITGLAFSPDGRRLLSCGSDFSARVWDTASGRELLTLSGHGDIILKVAWSRDGTRIATACQDGAVRVWTATGTGVPPVVEAWEDLTPARLADRVAMNGDWRDDGNALIGTLRELKPQNFSIAQVTLPIVDLPRTADVQFRVTVSRPMLIAVGLANSVLGLGYTPFIAASQLPFGSMGAHLLVSRERSDRKFSLQGVNRPFQIEAERSYVFRVLRENERLRFFVDGQELIDELVPAIELPELRLQGSWAAEGSEIRFADVRIRAPAAAVRDRQLRVKLERMFAEELLPEVVRARLAKDPTLTDADRQTLLAALATLPANVQSLRMAVRDVAAKDGATQAELERAQRQVRAVLELVGGLPTRPTDAIVGDLGLLAAIEYRLKNYDAAAEVMRPVLDFVRNQQGFNTRDELALAALIEDGRGKPDAARTYLQRLRDIDRPTAKWGPSSPLLTQAMRLADRLLSADPARERVKEAYLAIENGGWINNQFAAYFDGRTLDCLEVDQRGPLPGPYDFAPTQAAQKARRRLQFQEGAGDQARILHDEWNIRITGEKAELSCVSIVVIPGVWTGRWAVTATLQLVGKAWKIASNRSWQTHQTEDNQLIELTADYWESKDRAVAEAKTDAVKLTALLDARRYKEAFELGKKVVADEQASSQVWFNFSKAALHLGEATDAIRAAKKAHELAPGQTTLPPWAK